MNYETLKTVLLIVLTFILAAFLIKFGKVPDEYIAYPEKTSACARFYNYSTDGPDRATSEIIFTLKSDIGPCDIEGRPEIGIDGSINICTPSGWVTHQPDE